MAEDPIIIDDGGSTRIKRHMQDGIGDLNGLLDVKPDVGGPAAGRPGSQDSAGAGYGTKLTMTCIKDDGTPSTPIRDVPFKSFRIESGRHRVDGDLLADGKIRITVSGPDGSEPVVEARQHSGRRRYIVSNSQRISKVTVEPASGATDVTVNVSSEVIYTTVIAN
jgi:hypothetical protein